MKSNRIKLGVDVFLDDRVGLFKGQRVGLITNQTGVSSSSASTAELFNNHPGIDLVALFGPEHGMRGDAQAGEYVPFYIDKKLNLPVFSLYGQSKKKEPDFLLRIDETMRTFDTEDSEKYPALEMLQDIDVLVLDIQDVGTRIYTFLATMAFSMLSAAKKNISFVVLDRPNPINGVTMEGPILEYPKYSSFVGLYPIPVRHGMTLGELAVLFNENYLEHKVDLSVVPMRGWAREQWFDETNLTWINPSPNMPFLTTATVYPGQVFLEGTNISEGRGTAKPFELFGAPWIDGDDLLKELNGLRIPGVLFKDVKFTPTFSKYRRELCSGCRIHVVNREKYSPLKTSLLIIETVMDMYPAAFEFYSDYFDKIIGTAKVREFLECKKTTDQIVENFKKNLAVFKAKRKPYLLY
jgi:uncharacterized protein YbbC (DUF1343 family)